MINKNTPSLKVQQKKTTKQGTVTLGDGRVLMIPPKGGRIPIATIKRAVAKVVGNRRTSRAA